MTGAAEARCDGGGGLDESNVEGSGGLPGKFSPFPAFSAALIIFYECLFHDLVTTNDCKEVRSNSGRFSVVLEVDGFTSENLQGTILSFDTVLAFFCINCLGT